MRHAAVILILFAATAAAADESPRQQIARARKEYQAAEAAYKAGEWDKAIDGYQTAYDLSKRPLLLYNLGQAWRRKAEASASPDDRRTALSFYQKYVDAEPNGRATADARAYIEELRGTAAPEPPAAPVEPSPAPKPPVDAAPAPAPAPPEPDTGATTDPGRTYRIAGIATAAVGGVLVAGGVYFGLRAKSKSSDLDALQRGQMWDQDLYDSGKAAERNMFIFLGAGAAAIATGAVLYFVVGKPPPVEAAVVPAPGGASLFVLGRF